MSSIVAETRIAPHYTSPLAIASLPTARPTPTTTVRKRTIDDIADLGEDGSYRIKWNCNQIRTKIDNLINGGAVRVGEFQKKLGVNSRGYLMFMRQHGPHAGSGSNTYMAANEFFARMEDMGVKIAKAGSSRRSEGGQSTPDSTAYNVDGIELPINDDGKVPVYDSCDDIRNKISAHLRTTGVTKAAFLRTIAETSGVPPIQSKQLTDFTGKHGPMAGNSSKVFYAAYVYFEKLRVKHGKPKSKKREEMEKTWAHEGGVDISFNHASRGLWVHDDDHVSVNKYGRYEITSAGRTRAL